MYSSLFGRNPRFSVTFWYGKANEFVSFTVNSSNTFTVSPRILPMMALSASALPLVEREKADTRSGHGSQTLTYLDL